MTVSFQIDSTPMPLDPVEVQWEPKEVIDRAHSGKPVRDAYRTVRLTMPDMTMSDFAILSGYDDGGVHSAKIPAPASFTYTTYSGIYVRVVRAPSFQDIHVEGVELEISWLVA